MHLYEKKKKIACQTNPGFKWSIKIPINRHAVNRQTTPPPPKAKGPPLVVT